MFLKLCKNILKVSRKSSIRFYSSLIPDEEKSGDEYIKYRERSALAPDRRWTVETGIWKEQTEKGIAFEKPETCFENFDISKDPVEWTAVERLLPLKEIPEPPIHNSYPTPSGWFPPKTSSSKNIYFVRRTRFNQLPIYLETRLEGTHHLTVIRHCDGDLWALEAELCKYVEKITGTKPVTQVDEVCGKIRLKGSFLKEVSDFIIEKGF